MACYTLLPATGFLNQNGSRRARLIQAPQQAGNAAYVSKTLAAGRCQVEITRAYRHKKQLLRIQHATHHQLHTVITLNLITFNPIHSSTPLLPFELLPFTTSLSRTAPRVFVCCCNCPLDSG